MKTSILNRHGQKIVVEVDEATKPKGLAFVMHGLSGFKEQPHIQAMADAFRENGHSVVLFDTTNTFGESDGSIEEATYTSYHEDLEDVIKWSTRQPWYQEPFKLTGYSLGGLCVALYAERHPRQVKAVAPISSVVSGNMTYSEYPPEKLRVWERTGWLESPSQSKRDAIKRLSWNLALDAKQYDLLTGVDRLTMPVLLVIGSKDRTLLKHNRLLLERLPGNKQLHVIEEGPHTFREPKQILELRTVLSDWVKQVA